MYIDDNFMLTNEAARELYHDSAESLPIIDYHCHLDPRMIAENYQFRNLAEIWLGGDHYKWRAMRGNGVPEAYITGDKSDYEKFEKWAETITYAMRNPLYHWTHLELKRIFGINQVLKPETAREIYETCSEMLRTEDFRANAIMAKCGVETVCTTDDPADSLEYHKRIQTMGLSTKVYPAWRPDRLMAVEDPARFAAYVASLGGAANLEIRTYDDLWEALRARHDFFASMGCRVSDHGLDNFYAEDYTEGEMRQFFARLLEGKYLADEEIRKFKSGMLHELAILDWEKGWVQQYHISVIRNNCTRMFRQIGPDTGFDSIGDFTVGRQMSKFFDMLDRNDRLAKTIIYNLNPRDNELVATMIGNFQDGRYGAGKIQFGSGWWFLDQKDGMEKQMNALSTLGLLSRFVGMLTDSRSFLSYPRHEYFRRTLCNLVGNDIEQGLLPASEIDFIGREIIEGICYRNAKDYFKF